MPRLGAAATLLAFATAAPALAGSLVGEWHCVQAGAEVQVEAEARFFEDGNFTATMQYTFVRPLGRLVVTALYAATWRLEGDSFWDEPLDARVTGMTMNDEPAELPRIAEDIRRSLLEPPGAPMRAEFETPDFVILRGEGGGAPFQCVRIGPETEL